MAWRGIVAAEGQGFQLFVFIGLDESKQWDADKVSFWR
jgi:hypothetical protein